MTAGAQEGRPGVRMKRSTVDNVLSFREHTAASMSSPAR
jgi:hypothetical protein